MSFLPRTGSDLLHDLATLSQDLPVLIHDFLYANTSTMLAADPGIGKSIISTQVALSVAGALPCFGTFLVPEPRKVYYLQLEGAYYHTVDRLRIMQKKLPLVAENLCWDMGEGFNVLREADWLKIESRINSFGKPALLVIDPIYMLVMGGLSEDKPASAFVRFSNAMMQTFGCANWLNHHTHRARYSANGGSKVEEDDPFYGSQWLKAHLDASWLMSRTAANKVKLECKKDRNGVLTKRIDLVYHPDSMTCENILFANSPAISRVLAVIADCKARNITMNFQEIQVKSGVSHAHLRRLTHEIGKLNVVNFVKSTGKDTLWVPI